MTLPRSVSERRKAVRNANPTSHLARCRNAADPFLTLPIAECQVICLTFYIYLPGIRKVNLGHQSDNLLRPDKPMEGRARC